MVTAMFSVVLISLLILFDAFLFKEDVYNSPIEPTVISGIMQLIPWLVFPFVITDFSSVTATGIAFLSGMLNMIGFHLYFRAMNDDQDAVVISVMWNLMIALVPLLAYFAIDEKLAFSQYIGIATIFIGATAAVYHKARANFTVVTLMFLAVLLLSASSVMMKEVFNILTENGNPSIFWSGFLPHAAGAGLIGVFFLDKLFSKKESRDGIISLVKKFWPVFFLMEGIQVGADILSSLASTVGNISVIIAMDGLMGVFTAALSIGLAYALFRTKLREAAEEFRDEQFKNFGLKFVGMMLVVIGAYMVA